MHKKTILLLGFMVLYSSLLFGQSYVGIFGGFNSGKFSGDSYGDFQYAAGNNFTFGLGCDILLKEDIYLSILPSYANAGSHLQYPKEIDEEFVYMDSISLDFQLFNLPVLMKIISDNKRFQFSGGLEVMIPLRLMADNSVDRTDLSNDIFQLGINALFGIGYRIPIKKNLLILNFCYTQGLTNLANNLDDPNALLPRIRYTAFRFTVGWHLPVGKNKNNPSSTK